MQIAKRYLIFLVIAVTCGQLTIACDSNQGKADLQEAVSEAPVPQNSQAANETFSIQQDTAESVNQESYETITDNNFQVAASQPLSTFAIDVDTAAYTNVRRFLNNGQLPPRNAVRIEELINYFAYEYPQPTGKDPFSITTEVSTAPWQPKHKLVRIGLQGKQITTEDLKPSNLVFLLDVSGSMNDANKLPLLKSGFRLLVNELTEKDRVSIVVYAGAAGLVLPPTPGNEKEKILAAIESLEAGGSTAGGQGIELAYQVAEENFLAEGNNRVILATDGDFNVGVASDSELVKLIEKKREAGVFLTVLGFGTGNLQDSKMEKLADKGNGNYAYLDNILEAKKVLVTEMGGTLQTIAKDVKIQVEFNPAQVQAYRLIGYENRLLENRDFEDDTKDAGELGAGHSVTALYEVIPVGVESEVNLPEVNDSSASQFSGNSAELLEVRLRYKQPDAATSQLIVNSLVDEQVPLSATSDDFRFAAAVAAYGMILRDSEYKGEANLKQVLELANESKGVDLQGYRGEFISLVKSSQSLTSKLP
ncbi:MAG: VWA domain-containing protein [Oscillatoria sp. PMC 1068.18]|nr:VWA domain-containing protein [Oscillatoria sp. PMC 1076.18]MEC4990863.1 VWA domain-containing protein [Oscillatoria sp. PMC 1068.18]